MSDEISQFAIVELFGHKVIAGRVTKSTTTFPLLRIDVPPTTTFPAFTAEYGPAAIYGITYVSEEVAKHAAESAKVNPVVVYCPDLVTLEQHEKEVDRLKEQITALRRGLPAPSPNQSMRADDDDDDDERTILF